ncbi:MAG: hypothetical protein D6736_01195, partial [Nitrospinota bacterium]
GERLLSIEEWRGFVQALSRRRKRSRPLSPAPLFYVPLPSRTATASLVGQVASASQISLLIQVRTEAERDQLLSSLPATETVAVVAAETCFPALSSLLEIEEEVGSFWLSVAAALANSSSAQACLLSLPPDLWWEPVLHVMRQRGVQRGAILQPMPSPPLRLRIVHFQGIAVRSVFAQEEDLEGEDLVWPEEGMTTEERLCALFQAGFILFFGGQVTTLPAGVERVKRLLQRPQDLG